MASQRGSGSLTDAPSGRHRRADVVDRALVVLDTWGLADLTMRRLGAELGVRPSALYHHFPSKQALLAAVADELLERGWRRRRPPTAPAPWDERLSATCTWLRESMLACRDGAELVATTTSFGLGEGRPLRELRATVEGIGLEPELADTAARTVLHYVCGAVVDEQTHLQAASAGAIDAELRDGRGFEVGLALVVAGLRTRVDVSP